MAFYSSSNITAESSASAVNDEKPIDIVIYLHDDTGIMFKVRGGQSAGAKFLFDLLMKELNVQDSDISSAREVFSLWLVSDLIELQLKPNHVPFKLVCFWEELLEKYVHCAESIRQRDEPVIMLQKNVYAPASAEEKIEDPTLLKLLYHEARKNVISGKYPVNRDTADNLALIQTHVLYLEKQSDLAGPVSLQFFANNITDLLPSIHCKRSILMNRKQNPENRLMRLYEEHSSQEIYKNRSEESLFKEYLKICRSLFQYGAAFFSGQVEHQGKKLDDPVWIAISRNGVSIISINEFTPLLTAPFENLSWQFAESASNDANYLPCLFLHFPYSEGGTRVTKLLQIFSKSAYLADNLIDTLVNSRKANEDPKVGNLTVEISRLALMTFDLDGNKIDNTIRIPKKNLRRAIGW